MITAGTTNSAMATGQTAGLTWLWLLQQSRFWQDRGRSARSFGNTGCWGSRTGPTFPLKAKVLVRILQDPSLYQGPSALAHCDVSGEDWGLLTPSVPTSRVPPPTDWKVPPTPHFSVWQSHTLTSEQTDNQAHYNDCGGVVRAVP